MCNYLIQTHTDVDRGRMLVHFGKSPFCEFIWLFWDSCKYTQPNQPFAETLPLLPQASPAL